MADSRWQVEPFLCKSVSVEGVQSKAIPAGDKALETGDIEPVAKLLSEKMEHGVREHFKEALAKKKFQKNNVEAGREFIRAYVEYIHYVEGIHQAASSAAHGHFPEAEEAAAHSHQRKD